jgi:ubiquitin C-terminal hydrolase
VKTTNVLSTKPESFFILDLPIPTNGKPVNLFDCFDELTKNELLEGDNAWYNESSKKYQSVHKRMSFWSLPKVLVVTFKRFSPCGTQKIDELIDFPLNDLILSKYVCGYNSEKYVYDLFGVCNHYGGIEGGHYTSFVLNADGIWTHYNDSQYTIIQKENVVSKSAYCLFYRLNSNLLR